MNENVKRLYKLASKTSRNIIGLMSGTSLDGLDIAFCNVFGSELNTKVSILAFETVPYSDEVKSKIRSIFAKQTIDFQYFTVLNAWLGDYHAELINSFLEKNKINNVEVDLIASHGQTVFHAPKHLHKLEGYQNATLQIGDGDHIAVKTKIITLSDFRQKHIATGGEGAPLAVYGDYFMFSKNGENRLMLNMGGIANFTYLPASCNPTEVFVTDTGPGNTLIDAVIRKFDPSKSFDKDAEIARKGTVNQKLLDVLKSDPFFQEKFPKTTGPELFNYEYVSHCQNISGATQITIEDMLATLTRFSAETIAEAIQQITDPNLIFHIYLSGGGMHNPLLISILKDLLPSVVFSTTDKLDIPGDAKEAVLFAILANEAVAGGSTNFGNRQGIPTVSFGKISFPN